MQCHIGCLVWFSIRGEIQCSMVSRVLITKAKHLQLNQNYYVDKIYILFAIL